MQFRFGFFSEDFVVDNLSDGTEYSTYIRIGGTDIELSKSGKKLLIEEKRRNRA
jgi:hypothetical protein